MNSSLENSNNHLPTLAATPSTEGKIVRKQRGFTLIELLVVIAIIAILAGLRLVFEEVQVSARLTPPSSGR